MPKAALPRVRWETADAECVLAVIIRKSVCLLCIADRSGVAEERVDSILAALGEALGIRWTLEPCEACGQTQDVFRLG